MTLKIKEQKTNFISFQNYQQIYLHFKLFNDDNFINL